MRRQGLNSDDGNRNATKQERTSNSCRFATCIGATHLEQSAILIDASVTYIHSSISCYLRVREQLF
jgi:hypothetical protein